MAREDLHFRLRIPEGLKAKIEDAAHAHRRSMTAEIVARLEASFREEEPIAEPSEIVAFLLSNEKSTLEKMQVLVQRYEQLIERDENIRRERNESHKNN